MESKQCIECKGDKPLAEFQIKESARGYRDSKCKTCRGAHRRSIIHPKVVDGMKKCRSCSAVKDINLFSTAKRNKDGRDSYCNSCRATKKRKAYPEKKEQTWQARIWYNYMLTPADYQEILDKQGGVCAICQESEVNKRLSVDHDHMSGQVRGILCNKCNRSLGQLGDTKEAIQKVLDYLNTEA